MSAEQCRVPGCDKSARPLRRSGLCSMHQTRMDRHGSLADPRPSYGSRLLMGIDMSDADACWTWPRPLTAGGYGQVRDRNGRGKPAHRAVYEFFRGDVSSELHLDHLCRNRACVNPAHLEPVEPVINIRRGEPASRTSCPAGHAYSEENTRWFNGKRHCRSCHKTHQANYVKRKAARDVG